LQFDPRCSLGVGVWSWWLFVVCRPLKMFNLSNSLVFLNYPSCNIKMRMRRTDVDLLIYPMYPASKHTAAVDNRGVVPFAEPITTCTKHDKGSCFLVNGLRKRRMVRRKVRTKDDFEAWATLPRLMKAERRISTLT